MERVADDTGTSSAKTPHTKRTARDPAGVGLTVSEVLAAPCLADARVLAGASGLDRIVRRLNVMEVPEDRKSVV